MTTPPARASGTGPADRPLRVAYLVSRFPHLPETFVLREIDRLEQLGVEVVLCPLLRQRDAVVHPAARPWVDRAVYTPFASLALLRDLVRTVVRQPRDAAAALLAPLVGVASTPNFLVGTAGIVAKMSHIARVLREREVDHVHAHFATHPAMAAYMLHRLTGLPYSFTVHAHDLYVHTAMLERKLAAARFAVTISDYNRELLEQFGTGTPIHVVRSGVDLDRYPVQEEPPDGPFTLLSVGSLQPYKGFRHLIEAMAEVRARGEDGVRLCIVGGGPDHDELTRMIEARDLRDHVELLGAQPEEEVARLLQAAHAFVLPSVVMRSGKMEGLPVVLIEALACGLPTIATAISGIPELVRPGETGQLVRPSDPVAVAEAILWVREHPDEAKAQALEGRRLVEKEHQLDTNVAHLAALFGQEATG